MQVYNLIKEKHRASKKDREREREENNYIKNKKTSILSASKKNNNNNNKKQPTNCQYFNAKPQRKRDKAYISKNKRHKRT